MEKTNSTVGEKIIHVLTTLLFSSFYIFETNAYISVILFVLTIIIFGISLYERHFKVNIQLSLFHGLVFIFSLYCMLSSLWALEIGLSIDKGVTIFELLVCMSLLFSHYVKYDSIDSLLKSIMYSGFIVALYSFYNYKFSGILAIISSGGRMDNMISNANSIGMVCVFSIIIAIYYFLKNKNIWMFFLIIPNTIIVAASGSRKAFISMVIGVFFVFLLKNDDKKKKQILLTVIKLFFAIVITYLLLRFMMSSQLFAGLNERMSGLIALVTGNGVVDSSTLKRQEMIAAGFEQFKKTPIIGMGIGNAKYLGIYGYSYLHNNYIELLACGGIVGFLLYYTPYLYIGIKLLKFRRLSNELSNIVLIILVIILLMDYGSVTYYSKSTYFYLMMFFIHVNNLKNDSKIKLSTIREEK